MWKILLILMVSPLLMGAKMNRMKCLFDWKFYIKSDQLHITTVYIEAHTLAKPNNWYNTYDWVDFSEGIKRLPTIADARVIRYDVPVSYCNNPRFEFFNEGKLYEKKLDKRRKTR